MSKITDSDQETAGELLLDVLEREEEGKLEEFLEDTLEALLESCTPKTQERSFEDELNDIISESLKEKNERQSIAKLRERQKIPGVGKAEIELIRAKILEWELKHEWTMLSVGHYFMRQVCSCGEVSEVRIGYAAQQKHRSQNIQRFIKLAEFPANDWNSKIVKRIDCATIEHVQCCPKCMERQPECDLFIVANLEG